MNEWINKFIYYFHVYFLQLRVLELLLFILIESDITIVVIIIIGVRLLIFPKSTVCLSVCLLYMDLICEWIQTR